MGKKGSSTTYQERPLSDQELRLFETQNRMMEKGIEVAQQQDNRSQQMYDDWRNNYQGIETGEISGTANRSNGYSNNPYIVSREQWEATNKQDIDRLALLEKDLAGINQYLPQEQPTTTTSVKGAR